MLEIILEYSGLSAAWFSLSFVALPSLLAKFDRKKHSISYTTSLPKIGYVFNLGVFLSAISEVIFMIFLKNRFWTSHVDLGVLIFIFGAICLLGAGIVTLKKSHRFHTIFASSYFFLTSTGGVLIGLSLFSTNFLLAIVTSLFALTGLLAIYFYCIFRKNLAYYEYIVILCSALWALSFYLIR